VGFEIDEKGNHDYPVLIEVEGIVDPQEDRDGVPKARRTPRAKHLVGADGAHSQVRQSMGLRLEGETTDHIWEVVDFVADTDFPDIRKPSAIHSNASSVMIIPRESISTGEYLTRLYVQAKEEVALDLDIARGVNGADIKQMDNKKRQK
jgi:phenol 2-monooxygenase (NADPH)